MHRIVGPQGSLCVGRAVGGAKWMRERSRGYLAGVKLTRRKSLITECEGLSIVGSVSEKTRGLWGGRSVRWHSTTPSGGRPWWKVLGVAPDASENTVQQAYHNAAFEHHPDRGGDPETFRLIREAYDEARASFEAKKQPSSATEPRLTFKRSTAKGNSATPVSEDEESTSTENSESSAPPPPTPPLTPPPPPRDPLDFEFPSLDGANFFGQVKTSQEGLLALGEYMLLRRQISATTQAPNATDLRNWARRTFASLSAWQGFIRAHPDGIKRVNLLKQYIEDQIEEEAKKERAKAKAKAEKAAAKQAAKQAVQKLLKEQAEQAEQGSENRSGTKKSVLSWILPLSLLLAPPVAFYKYLKKSHAAPESPPDDEVALQGTQDEDQIEATATATEKETKKMP